MPVEAMSAWGLYASAPTAARAAGGGAGDVVCEPALLALSPDGELAFVSSECEGKGAAGGAFFLFFSVSPPPLFFFSQSRRRRLRGPT